MLFMPRERRLGRYVHTMEFPAESDPALIRPRRQPSRLASEPVPLRRQPSAPLPLLTDSSAAVHGAAVEDTLQPVVTWPYADYCRQCA